MRLFYAIAFASARQCKMFAITAKLSGVSEDSLSHSVWNRRHVPGRRSLYAYSGAFDSSRLILLDSRFITSASRPFGFISSRAYSDASSAGSRVIATAGMPHAKKEALSLYGTGRLIHLPGLARLSKSCVRLNKSVNGLTKEFPARAGISVLPSIGTSPRPQQSNTYTSSFVMPSFLKVEA